MDRRFNGRLGGSRGLETIAEKRERLFREFIRSNEKRLRDEFWERKCADAA